ncbi:hypothetical protein NFC81_13700 [Salinispirillum sp. LH 10-3-1]|uniref:Uncharacterized protein n=1 Tax=Salinispirillum sp. LH 10-3-1 TaxID=2952525 RepID=A0AB38YEH3_9GAMM
MLVFQGFDQARPWTQEISDHYELLIVLTALQAATADKLCGSDRRAALATARRVGEQIGRAR